MIKANTDCMAIPPATLTTLAVPAAITLDAITSGAGIGISPKKGILKVATDSDDKVSLGIGRVVGIVSGVSSNAPSVEDAFSSSAEDP